MLGSSKVEYFEYATSKLIEWACQSSNRSIQSFESGNDFSKLKVLKLHFFLCAVNSKTNTLLNVFDSFYAMPYGHVESDIYNAINLKGLKRFDFLDSRISIKCEFIEDLPGSFNQGIADYKSQIDSAIEALKNENYSLVEYSAMDLVELSHLWTSWKVSFKIARSKNIFSQKIPAEAIQAESKFFAIAE